MEIRASYVVVGAVVLALLAGLVAFSLWLVDAGVDRNLARYEIAFAGSVSGLPDGGQVLYRGIPVGRVADIRIDPANVENVLVTVEIDRETPIKEDTVATLEFQGLTGIAYVQLRGGTQQSARLDPNAAPPPRIPSRRSTLERVFDSTPELVAQASAVVERLNLLLTDDNLTAVAGTLQNVEKLTAGLADRSGSVETLVTGAAGMTEDIQKTSVEVRQLVIDLRQLTGRVDQPVDDFAATGLYEFTQLIGETRQLVAALSRITKEFERDPAGFLIGRSSRGYKAE
jgi:phospholipid/cholesterol/gamma-HCH transport system substrate-binding protein